MTVMKRTQKQKKRPLLSCFASLWFPALCDNTPHTQAWFPTDAVPMGHTHTPPTVDRECAGRETGATKKNSTMTLGEMPPPPPRPTGAWVAPPPLKDVVVDVGAVDQVRRRRRGLVAEARAVVGASRSPPTKTRPSLPFPQPPTTPDDDDAPRPPHTHNDTPSRGSVSASAGPHAVAAALASPFARVGHAHARAVTTQLLCGGAGDLAECSASARPWAPVLARLAAEAVSCVDVSAVLSDDSSSSAPLAGLAARRAVAPSDDSRVVAGVALRGRVLATGRWRGGGGGGNTTPARVAALSSDLRGGDAGVAVARVAAARAGADVLLVAGDIAPDVVAALEGGPALVANVKRKALARLARGAGATAAPDAASLRPDHVFDVARLTLDGDDSDGRALVALEGLPRAVTATLVLASRGGRSAARRAKAVAGAALAHAWRVRLETALLADSMASAAAAAGWFGGEGGGSGPPTTVRVAALAAAVDAAATASAAAVATARAGAPIVSSSPHVVGYDAGEALAPADGDTNDDDDDAAARRSWRARQRLWVSAATAAPTADLPAPCAPPAVVRYDFYRPVPASSSSSTPWRRPDEPLASTLARVWRRADADACGVGACAAHPAEHVRVFLHSRWRVTLTAGRLPAGDALTGSGWWLWRAHGLGAPPPAARRVPLSPEAAALSLAHLLELAFGCDWLGVPPPTAVAAEPPRRGSNWLRRAPPPPPPPPPSPLAPLRDADLFIACSRSVARFAVRPLDVASLEPPAGPVAPAPCDRAAALRGETAALVVDADAALATLAAGAVDVASSRARAAAPHLAAVLAGDRAALAAAVGVAVSAVDAACDAADCAADAAAAATAAAAAVSALAGARRTLTKIVAAWAARLGDEGLLERADAEARARAPTRARTATTPCRPRHRPTTATRAPLSSSPPGCALPAC